MPIGKPPDAVLANLSAAESEKFGRTHQRLVIQEYLPATYHDGVAGPSKCEWSSHVAADLTAGEVGALAWVLIDSIMKARFGPATTLYDTWRQHTDSVSFRWHRLSSSRDTTEVSC